MATTKKKTFDAVAQSRRWRIATSKRLNKMKAEEQIAFLNRRLANLSVVSVAKRVRRTPVHR
ncbi:MAG TPA: hypothetical protein VNW30_10005 [Opitutaceae bacterium]|jgi:hypothetical protein|nr:hypothetical protein [Opitutaceae bacterium]